MRGARVFAGFAMATTLLGVLLLIVCTGAWAVTVAGGPDVAPTTEMWRSAGGLVMTGLLLRWLLGTTTRSGQENR